MDLSTFYLIYEISIGNEREISEGYLEDFWESLRHFGQ